MYDLDDQVDAQSLTVPRRPGRDRMPGHEGHDSTP